MADNMADISNLTFLLSHDDYSFRYSEHNLSRGHPGFLPLNMDQKTQCTSFEFYYFAVVLGCICILGYTGNILCLVVLQTTPKRTSNVTLILLKALASTDLVYVGLFSMVQVWPRYVLCLPPNAGPSGDHHVGLILAYAECYLWPFVSISLNITTWLIVLMAVHRYIVVCYPLHACKYSTTRGARIQIAVVTVVALLVDFPRFWERTIHIELVNNSTNIHRNNTWLFTNDYYQTIYKNILMLMYRKLVPLAICITLSARLIHSLYRASYARQMLSFRRSPRSGATIPWRRGVVEKKITRAQLAVIMTFIVCQLPGAVYPILRVNLNRKYKKFGSFYYYFYLVADGLSVLNSAVNFMIYMLCSDEFNAGFRRLFCSCHRTVHIAHKCRTRDHWLRFRGSHEYDSNSTSKTTTMSGSTHEHQENPLQVLVSGKGPAET